MASNSLQEVFVYYGPGFSKKDAISSNAKIIYDVFALMQLSNDDIDNYRVGGIHIEQVPDKTRFHLGTQSIARSSFPIPDVIEGVEEIPVTWIVQFVGPLKAAWSQTLIEKGAQIYGYVTPYSIFAYMKPSLAKQIMDLRIDGEGVVEFVGRYVQEAKVQATPENFDKVIVHRFPWNQGIPPPQGIGLPARFEDILYVEPYQKPHLLNTQTKIMAKDRSCHH